MSTQESWIMEALPSGVLKVSEEAKVPLLNRFEKLVECRQSPIAGSPHLEGLYFYWPKPPLQARAVPGGVASLDEEDGFNYVNCMDRFFANLVSQRIYFWGINYDHLGMFDGTYNEDVRLWIKRNYINIPTIIMSQNEDVVLISEEDFCITAVGGKSETLSVLENAFGGHEQLRMNFINWVDEGGVGDGDSGKTWGHKYAMVWSGWAN